MRKLSRLQNSMEQALAAAHHVWEVMDEHARSRESRRQRAARLKKEIELRMFRLVMRMRRDRSCAM
jgi:hypothetical protein